MRRVVSSDPLNRSRFPADEWRLVEREPSALDVGHTRAGRGLGHGQRLPGEYEQGSPHGQMLDQ